MGLCETCRGIGWLRPLPHEVLDCSHDGGCLSRLLHEVPDPSYDGGGNCENQRFPDSHVSSCDGRFCRPRSVAQPFYGVWVRHQTISMLPRSRAPLTRIEFLSRVRTPMMSQSNVRQDPGAEEFTHSAVLFSPKKEPTPIISGEATTVLEFCLTRSRQAVPAAERYRVTACASRGSRRAIARSMPVRGMPRRRRPPPRCPPPS